MIPVPLSLGLPEMFRQNQEALSSTEPKNQGWNPLFGGESAIANRNARNLEFTILF